MDIEELRSEFRQPGNAYRSVPFWSWNDRLSIPELLHQIDGFKEQGMGGFFMHAREGLETVYLGEEWFRCTEVAIKAAKDTGLSAWLYDEDRFPSGCAGGAVAAKGDHYRAKGLTLEIVRSGFKWDDATLAVFSASVDGYRLEHCERLPRAADIYTSQDGVLLVFRKEVPLAGEWFNDDAPADNMEPDAVRAFLDCTHEAYKRHVGESFGNTVPGIFTDEPTATDFRCVFQGGRKWIPWTDGFADFFRSRRGYDVLDIVPFIFFNAERSAKARHDYWRTVTERFCEAYSRQIGEWCESNGLSFTGHYAGEHSLGISALVSGAVMPHYRFQQIPGIDLLGEQTGEFLTAKQCASVANQYRRSRAVCEMYGCCGWDLTFEGQKWIGDWCLAMGINLRCQHIAHYSLRGCRKRDFPSLCNYNAPWWKYDRLLEDYFARIATILSQGDPVRDLLVLHPASTVWSMTGSFLNGYLGIEDMYPDPAFRELEAYEQRFKAFIECLLRQHCDFDFGDETIMAEEGKVEGGKIFVGHAGYSVVALYGLHTILKSTAKLLKSFLDAGGRVLAIGEPAKNVEGEPAAALAGIFRHKNVRFFGRLDEAMPALEAELPRRVRIRGRLCGEAQDLLYCLTEGPQRYSLFVANTDRDHAHDAEINVNAQGRLEEWDPLGGNGRAVPARIENRMLTFNARFGPAASRLYTIEKNALSAEEGKVSAGHMAVPSLAYASLGPDCAFARTMPNALLLDECAFRVEDGGWSEKMYVWEAQRKIRERLGMRQVHYVGTPQRYRWAGLPHAGDGTRVSFRFEFDVDYVPVNPVYLSTENGGESTITLNGLETAAQADGWYLDKSFERFGLPGLRLGVNELIVSFPYRNDTEAEDCFIIGDFGVDAGRRITREPRFLHMGDWCTQGYFHYSGGIVYHFEADLPAQPCARYFLELGKYSAVTVEVRVNGAHAGHVPWRAANRLDITPFLADGKSSIDIEVTGSPVNLFGPFHQVGNHNPWTDLGFYTREGARTAPGYAVKPYGLLEPVSIFRET